MSESSLSKYPPPTLQCTPAHHLLQSLPVYTRLLLPERRLEVFAPFVDCQRVVGILDNATEFHVMELPEIVRQMLEDVIRNPQGPYRVPDADKFNFHLPRKAAPEGFRLLSVRLRRRVAASIKPVGIRNLIRMNLPQQPTVANKTGQASRRVCPPAEAKEIQVIARRIIVDEKGRLARLR